MGTEGDTEGAHVFKSHLTLIHKLHRTHRQAVIIRFVCIDSHLTVNACIADCMIQFQFQENFRPSSSKLQFFVRDHVVDLNCWWNCLEAWSCLIDNWSIVLY